MIELYNVTVSYPNHVVALDNVSICVGQGEFVFVVGPTGAGKSTFLKLLYREERPTSGRIVVAGKDVSTIKNRDIPYFRRKLGIVFQDFGLLPNKTVYENVAFALRVIGAGRQEIRHKVPEALDMVGMAHRPDAFGHQLSGGEQQRVAIARALVNSPTILLADEPTGNLDPDTSLGIMRLLQHIHRTGTTVLVATHDSAVVDRLQRRVIGFVQGQLVRDDLRGAYNASPEEEPNEELAGSYRLRAEALAAENDQPATASASPDEADILAGSTELKPSAATTPDQKAIETLAVQKFADSAPVQNTVESTPIQKDMAPPPALKAVDTAPLQGILKPPTTRGAESLTAIESPAAAPGKSDSAVTVPISTERAKTGELSAGVTPLLDSELPKPQNNSKAVASSPNAASSGTPRAQNNGNGVREDQISAAKRPQKPASFRRPEPKKSGKEARI